MALPPDRITCPLCAECRAFASPPRLLRHIQVFHCYDSNKVAFECNQCNFVGHSFDMWRAHVTSHETTPNAMDWQYDNFDFLQSIFSKIGPDICLERCLQSEAAKFLLHLRDKCNATDIIFKAVTGGTDALIEIVLDIIQKRFNNFCRNRRDHYVSHTETCQILDELRGNSLFEGLQTPDALVDFIKGQKCFVPPEDCKDCTKPVFRSGVPRDLDLDKGYYVGFLPMLKNLLNCQEVLQCVDYPEPNLPGVFKGPLDGYAYTDNPLVKKHGPSTLAIASYDDDVGLTDSASSQSRKVKFIYWQLLNLSHDLRSQNNAIHLLSCVESDTIGRLGHKVFMDDFVKGIKELESDEGVTFEIAGKERVFHGFLLEHLGDNPASARVAGCKETHFAEKLCRQCLVSKEGLFSSFVASDFPLRDKITHEMQLKEVEEFQLHPQRDAQSPSVFYGIKSRSVFSTLKYFDVTKCFPQDLLHDVILGSLKQEICCLLLHVLEKKMISLAKIDDQITHLSKFFGVNKPPPLSMDKLKECKVRGSGAETLALANMLPFALTKDLNASDLEFYCDEENLQCYILRLNILDFEMSSQFTLSDVSKLENMIKEHHTRFEKLYPGKMTPKFHFEIHMPMQILLFGPLRTHWCFRHEGKHAWFKRIARSTHNFKDICGTLSMRHQEKQCGYMMMSHPGNPYLHSTDKLGVPKPSTLQLCDHSSLVSKVFPDIQDVATFFKHTFSNHRGVHYAKDKGIVTAFSGQQGNMPELGEIVAIYSHCNVVAFVYEKLVTEKYDWHLNAFKVRHTEQLDIILQSNLVYHQNISYIKSVNYNYVILPCHSLLSAQF